MLSNGGLKALSFGKLKKKIFNTFETDISREINKVFTLHINEGTLILKKLNLRSLRNIIVIVNQLFLD